MIEDSGAHESLQIAQIRNDLENWLKAETWEFNELRYWIKGYKFFDYGDEPYLWLSRCLPKSSKYLPSMAQRIAIFLEIEEPYKRTRRTEDDDDSLFYNLFSLSAGLGYRRELGRELSRIFHYFSKNKNERKD